uniref:ShKT domain-containing protein n=1 Tax=Ditylenchus dipsaci TaxID=166011 RepID=A0A915DZB1_9BILA
MSAPENSKNESLQVSFHPGFALSARQNESLQENVSNSIHEIDKDDLRKDSEEQAPFFNFLEIQNAKLHAPTKPNEITVQGRIPVSFTSNNPYAPKQLKKRRPNKNQQCFDQSGWECRWKRHLCRNTFYTTVMRRNCARTCGFCKSRSKPKPGGYPMKTRKTSPHMKSYTRRFEKFVPNPQSPLSPLLPANIIFPNSTPRFSPNFPQFRIPKPNSGQFVGKFGNMGVVFPNQQHQNMVANRQNSFFNHLYVPCVNTALDCDEKLDLCTHQHYWKLMRRVCALSCEFCENDFL